jgi:hypothetical protein
MLAIGLAFPAFSADYYDTGSQLFSFHVGVTVPAFSYFFSDGELDSWMGEDGTGMGLGGYGSISYQVFSSSKSALGGEIGYDFNYSVGEELFTAIPFFAKWSYYPIQGAVDVPFSLGLGAAYISYDEGSLLTMYAQLEGGVVWYPTDNWGFGINTGFWLIPELNYNEDLQDDNALFGMIPVTLSVTYRQ